MRVDLRNLWEEELMGLQVLGVARRGKEMSGTTSRFSGATVDGSAFSEVGTLRRNHFREGRALVGTCRDTEVVRAQGARDLVGS